MIPPPPHSTLFPYTTLFRSHLPQRLPRSGLALVDGRVVRRADREEQIDRHAHNRDQEHGDGEVSVARSEEHTSELQSRVDLVCRLLLEKKKINMIER